MDLLLVRNDKDKNSVIGDLYIDGKLFCKTLEDTERIVKIAKITAIPKGTYTIVLSWSNRFKQYMPEILNVPGFTGIRIHWGVKPEHTEGCILVATKKIGESLLQGSMPVYERLFKLLKSVEKKEKITITIK